MRKNKVPDELRGSSEFGAYFSSLDKESELYQKIINNLNLLKGNMLIGNKIEKKKWPKVYVTKYEIYNLFRMETGKESRLIYKY
ncbi:MAG: hypothetical protein NUK63_05230 [Candidatus Bathyarchaeum tardum]|nr:MAG: hypothetical protein NUK63_05230 [Candidatus Bathyarchaeum tardum]